MTDAGDIVEEYPWLVSDKPETSVLRAETASLSREEKSVYDVIVEGCDQFDRLIEKTRLQPANLNRVLTSLSLKGLVTNIGSQYLPGQEGSA